MKHVVISNMRFEDKELFKKYLVVTKDILIPSLQSQKNKNFLWCVLICKEDIEFIRKELNFDFLPFNDSKEYFEYVKFNNINIQTRHDIDDYMADTYIEKIQELYNENINEYDSFLIQAQPLKVNYHTKEEVHIEAYTSTRNSMFLSLCQNSVKHHILEKQHGQFFEICPNVITIPEGYVKWIIHGNNISCKRGIK